MNVDIQQILTHILGFLIVLWILRKFAWQPILKVLEDRRQKIKSDFDAAAAKRQEAADLADQYTARMRDIENEARAKLQDAIEDGRRVAAEIREEARGEARKIIDKARADLERDVAKAKVELRNQLVNMTMSATERVIRQTVDEKAHRQLITDFIDELERSPAGNQN